MRSSARIKSCGLFPFAFIPGVVVRVRVWWVAAFTAGVIASFTYNGYVLLTAALLVGVFGVHVRNEMTLRAAIEQWARDAS